MNHEELNYHEPNRDEATRDEPTYDRPIPDEPTYDQPTRGGPVGGDFSSVADGGGHQVPAPNEHDSPSAGSRRWKRPTVTVAALVAAIVASSATTGAVVHAVDRGRSAGVASSPSSVTTPTTLPAASIRSALVKILPSVVLINDTVTTSPAGHGSFGGFGGFEANGAGTGVVVSSDGLVVTNAHVVDGATQINVTLPDGGTHAATIVGMDTNKDLAVIKVSGVSGLTPATFGNSAAVQVGDPVLAIGNALGYGGEPTVTEGIISATGRSLQDGTENLSGLLQTDAALNPGNSGGPLVDTSGRVIGINVAVATGSPGEPAQNIGFAIPSNTVVQALPSLESGSEAPATPSRTTAFLGVGVSDAPNGARVDFVQPSSPAARAGLQVGDVITAVDGTAVSSASDLQRDIQSKKPGSAVTLRIIRGGATQTVTATLGSTQVAS
ncbi:MAG: trypsin-like peptidase domain-containing protein [Acidothermus sp.]|nr:trypsin-like peptidase domain-containing protein [Acidothermus sp.]